MPLFNRVDNRGMYMKCYVMKLPRRTCLFLFLFCVFALGISYDIENDNIGNIYSKL